MTVTKAMAETVKAMAMAMAMATKTATPMMLPPSMGKMLVKTMVAIQGRQLEFNNGTTLM
jgi:hypothetical protein